MADEIVMALLEQIQKQLKGEPVVRRLIPPTLRTVRREKQH